MHRYVAFLRAINVGGHTVKMERLRALFEMLGLGGVETFIASGNVIFDSPVQPLAELEEQIERHLQQALGFPVATFLRTTAELRAIAEHEPFSSSAHSDGHALSIGLLKAPPPEEARERLLRFRTEIDDLYVHQREVYWLRRMRISESTFSGAVLEKALGMPATLRNVTTMRKLAAKYPPPRTSAETGGLSA